MLLSPCNTDSNANHALQGACDYLGPASSALQPQPQRGVCQISVQGRLLEINERASLLWLHRLHIIQDGPEGSDTLLAISKGDVYATESVLQGNQFRSSPVEVTGEGRFLASS